MGLPAIWDQTVNLGGPLVKNAGAIAAAIGICKLLLDLWRRTLGRRRRWIRLYRQLSLGLQLDYAFELFGKAAYKREVRDGDDNAVTEYVWPLAEDGYLQTIISEDFTIIRYSLTTRTKRFHPRLKMGCDGNSGIFFVKLGRTTFAEIPGEPTDIYLARGASFSEYGENRYLGRPGKFADWICSHNQMGAGKLEAIPLNIPIDDSAERLSPDWYDKLSEADRSQVHSFRANTTVNTVTVSRLPHTNPGKLSFGPRSEGVDLGPR
jgi:hypothetical protein